ncbi:MAG TPA: hypothetical protein VGC42_25305 [Kofleriaceae bacterium]
MPRLGELLVAAGILTIEQVEQALRAQVMWGGRLGTNLVELHHLDLDVLAQVLARQHRMPAALGRHFEKADPALQRLLSPDFAERFSCVPLLRMGAAGHVVVAAIAPLPPRQLAIVADELAIDPAQIIPAIGAELRIRYQLERVYNLRRATRFLRARGKTIPPFPRFEILPVPPDAEDGEPEPRTLPVSTREMAEFRLPDAERRDEAPAMPDAAAPEPIEDDASARERRTYVRTLADEPGQAERVAPLGRIAIRKVATGSAPRIMAGATLGEATRAIRRGTGRDRVADLLIDTLERFTPCEAALLLVIRGALAIGWKGFQRGRGALGELAVPLDGGLIPAVVQHNHVLRQPCRDLAPIDRLLLDSLGQDAGDLVVVPIAIADQVLCVIALAAAEAGELPGAEAAAQAAAAAFARLMRDASR